MFFVYFSEEMIPDPTITLTLLLQTTIKKFFD